MAVRRAAVAWAATLVVACGLLALPLVAFAATSSVTIQNFAFTPNSPTITVGDTVTWTNRDAASHSAKFSDRSTAVLMQGQSGSLQFTVAGTFPYICGIHGASMQGTIIVRAAATIAPIRESPPIINLMASVAWMMPTSPGKIPSTPPSAHEGTSPGGGGSG